MYLPSGKIIDFLRFRFKITAVLDFLLLKKITRICKTEEIEIDQVWSFDPNLHGYLHRYPAFKKVFFVADQIQSTSQTRASKKADLVVSVAEEILNKFRNINKNCLLINHGLNRQFENFAVNQLRKLETAVIENQAGKRLQVGYVGNLLIPFLYEEGLKEIVSKNPQIDFHFWGAHNAENNNLLLSFDEKIVKVINYLKEECTNTKFYGVCTPDIIINDFDKIDMFIYINSSVKDINGGANSHKILEYLCTGKVVVSTYLSFYANAGLFPMSHKAGEAGYAAIFCNAVKDVAELNNISLQRKRINYTLDNTYKKNVEKIFERLENFALIESIAI